MKVFSSYIKHTIVILLLVFQLLCYGQEKHREVIKEQNYKLILEAAQLILDYYVDPNISSEKLVNSAIKGMFNSLDPYSYFYEGQEEFEQETSVITDGYYCGIGITTKFDNGFVTIVEVKKGTAADKAGLEKGDVIKKIDNSNLSNLGFSETLKKLRGKEGAKIELTVIKLNSSQEKTYLLRREKINVNVVDSHMNEDICYINASMLSANTAKEIRQAVQNYFADGKKIEGIILDLRGNGGGSTDSAREVASYFLDSGILTKLKSRINPSNFNTIYIDKDVAKAPKVPLVVLVDEKSASASEMFAGAIKDSGRGILIGTKTFGKGIGQTYLPLRDKICKLTTSEFFTPNGSQINKVGITPHIIIEKSTKPEENLAFEPKPAGLAQTKYLLDKQYAKAIDTLIGYIKFSKIKN